MRLAACLLAILALAACSRGGSDERLSREEYVKRADAICAAYERRLERLRRPENVAELGRLADEALPIAREGVRKLRALKPPEELRRDVAEWLRRNDRNVLMIEALGDAARAGETTRVREIASDAADNERAADALAKNLGLRACARS